MEARLLRERESSPELDAPCGRSPARACKPRGRAPPRAPWPSRARQPAAAASSPRPRRVARIAPVPPERRADLAELAARPPRRRARPPGGVPAAGTRQELVGDVADEHVAERVLLVPLEGGHVSRPTRSRRSSSASAAPSASRVRRHSLERATPEHLAGHRRVEQHRALARRQRVEACRDQPPDRRRQRGLGLTGLRERRDELLDEERVAVGELREVGRRARRARRCRARSSRCAASSDASCAVERAKRSAECARSPPPHVGPRVQKVRAREHERRGSAGRAASRREAPRGRAGSRPPSAGPRTRASSAGRARPPR